jgi:ABC-2 type transport system ATP-binding protein
MIELHNATKLYQNVIGLNDMSLSLPPGTYGLLGPNGSGKTTLINLILGQLKPTLGRVRLFGKDPWRRSHLLRRVGLCPATDIYYPRVTGREWVTYLTKMHGIRSKAAGQKAVAAMEQVRMDQFMDQPIQTYSLGMRQRTKIAQAIAHQPDLLILDEPFNGLDPVGRHEMIDFVKEWASAGRSVILASHVLHEIEAIHPSFLLISGGRLLASGSPQEVHRILADSPFSLEVRCNHPAKLAQLLVEQCKIESIEFHDDGQGMIVTTRSASNVYDKLPSLIVEANVEVTEMNSTDDSLKALFATLMKIHRGEIKGSASQ